jgi:hypothetical protein
MLADLETAPELVAKCRQIIAALSRMGEFPMGGADTTAIGQHDDVMEGKGTISQALRSKWLHDAKRAENKRYGLEEDEFEPKDRDDSNYKQLRAETQEMEREREEREEQQQRQQRREEEGEEGEEEEEEEEEDHYEEEGDEGGHYGREEDGGRIAPRSSSRRVDRTLPNRFLDSMVEGGPWVRASLSLSFSLSQTLFSAILLFPRIYSLIGLSFDQYF